MNIHATVYLGPRMSLGNYSIKKNSIFHLMRNVITTIYISHCSSCCSFYPSFECRSCTDALTIVSCRHSTFDMYFGANCGDSLLRHQVGHVPFHPAVHCEGMHMTLVTPPLLSK